MADSIAAAEEVHNDKESRNFLPSGPYIPVKEIPNEIRRFFESKKNFFFPFSSSASVPAAYPPPGALRPDEVRTLSRLAEASLIIFVVVVIVVAIVVLLICFYTVAECCRQCQETREEKRYKKELRRRQRHAAATGNVSFDNGGISRRNSELVPSAARSPIYQVETDNHQRKSVIVPSPSASSVSSGRSKMSALVHPPPSILVTGDVDPPPPSTRHQSLNRSLGGIYEELGPPSAPPPPPAGVFRSGSNTNYLVPRADAGARPGRGGGNSQQRRSSTSDSEDSFGEGDYPPDLRLPDAKMMSNSRLSEMESTTKL